VKKGIKYACLFFVLIWLWLSYFQGAADFVKIQPLGGAYTPQPNTPFTLAGWMSGEYQEKKEAYKNENFGFRNFLVRLNHQLNFMFFRTAKASGVIVGKEGYLYERAYIDAYYGRDAAPMEKLSAYVERMKAVQDSMQKKNKLFFFVFASGKASFFPEYIPDYLKSEGGPTNYDRLRSLMQKYQVNFIDFNRYFVTQKGRTRYPLYPQYGIHWSNYASAIVFDSLLRYIEHQTARDLPDITNIEFLEPDTLVQPDDDLISGMNLLWQPRTYRMAFPLIYYNDDPARFKKLNSLVVGDSYWWVIYNRGWQKYFFNLHDFWYYNNEAHPYFRSNYEMFVKRLNYYRRLREMDVVMIVNTEATLSLLNYGFVDICYEVFCKPVNSNREQMQEIKEQIVTQPEWLASVKEKAKKENLSLDSMLTLDADWLLKNQSPKQ
jgi:hypothetical protein